MSATARVAGKVHKWLGLLMAIQILFWFVSGLFFAIAPIDQVRSEHVKATSVPPPVSAQAAAAGLQRIAADVQGEKIEIRSLLGTPVALVSPHEGRSRLYDLDTGRLLSPVSAAQAREIAEADYAGDRPAARVTLVTGESTEYRAALPAWRVDFDDDANRALYVAQDTGVVTARRSTLWRVFDFLWSLHIMDFKNHEDFNTPLLIGATGLSLVMIVAGIILFPSRLGFNAWRRRRKKAQGKRYHSARVRVDGTAAMLSGQPREPSMCLLKSGAPSSHHTGPRSPNAFLARSTAARAAASASGSASDLAAATPRRAFMSSFTRRSRSSGASAGLLVRHKRPRTTK